MEYKYGMRLRGFSVGCQPMDGFLRREDDPTGQYHDILYYDRELTREEQQQYSLDRLRIFLSIQERWAKDYNAVTILKPAPEKKKRTKRTGK